MVNLEDDHYIKECRSLNRALVTIIVISCCYILTACVLSILFGLLSLPISSGEIIFIMVTLSVFRTLFSILIPIYNFDPILHAVKEYQDHARFFVHDTMESIYLCFSWMVKSSFSVYEIYWFCVLSRCTTLLLLIRFVSK